jgi:hypothetical protein
MIARRTNTRARLPGFSFTAQPPPLPEVLPRMDVAIFVGFAASGPLNLPIAVEDATQFAAIFGEDAPLAWDTERGEQSYAYLAPAVRAFFRNGSRRCWVVRVAGEGAATNEFPIPGMLRLDAAGALAPAFAQARSAGSWSDALRVSATLLSRRLIGPLNMPDWRAPAGERPIDLALIGPDDVRAGDLLRLSFGEDLALLLAVQSVAPIEMPGSPPAGRTRGSAARVLGTAEVWFQRAEVGSVPAGASAARLFAGRAEPRTVPLLDGLGQDLDGSLSADLLLPFTHAPLPGTILRIDADEGELWLSIEQASAVEGGSPIGEITRVRGSGFWRRGAPPEDLPAPSVELLTFELWAQQGSDAPQRLSDLGFAPTQPNFWGALPLDEQRYQPPDALKPAQQLSGIAAAAAQFPLAGFGETDAIYLPLALAALPEHFLGPIPRDGSPLERDGLATFSAALFTDPELRDVGTLALLSVADDIRYLRPETRRLAGIHAALSVDEATLVAVPDAAQRGWYRPAVSPPLEPEPSPPLPRPEWWPFIDCSAAPEELARIIRELTPPQWWPYLDAHPEIRVPLATEPDREHFLTCGLRVVEPPELSYEQANTLGTFRLSWASYEPGKLRFVLEEARQANWADAKPIYEGPDESLAIYGRSQGAYYYRVRVLAGNTSSDWSNGVVVRVAVPGNWQLLPATAYAADDLLAVQRSLLRACAARGDLLAVLGLPAHYREDDVVDHVAVLKSGAAQPIFVGDSFVAPIGVGEAAAFSYAALYHPWVSGREENQPAVVRSSPPEGAACGVLARRALARGAWIAAANEPLRGVVALAPPIAPAQRLRLQEAQANLLRQEPRGFVALSADTLSDDEELRPINVRRLLILLRRLALKRGASLVFEPNDDSFRRLVKRNFDEALGLLFERGAFAGRTREESFRVVVDASVNPPQSVELGRFVVELRVAPSLPLTFVTVRLVQSGERGSVTEERQT